MSSDLIFSCAENVDKSEFRQEEYHLRSKVEETSLIYLQYDKTSKIVL